MATRHYDPIPDRDGDPYQRLPRHVLRIGDAEREAAAADLGDHYVAGRLTIDELHDRLGRVFAARTHGQLGKVLADLPGLTRPQYLVQTGLTQAGPAWPGLDRVPEEAAQPERPQAEEAGRDTAADRAGRFAALSLLILAMAIWLFTAYLFARHGYAHPGPGPWGPGH